MDKATTLYHNHCLSVYYKLFLFLFLLFEKNIVFLHFKHKKNNTMKKIKFFALALAATFCFGLTSCDKDKDLDYQSQILKDGDMIQVHDLDIDAMPIYKLNFTFGIKGGNLVVEGLSSKPEFPNPPAYMSDPTTVASIVDYGEVKGLSLIENLPDSAAFEPSGKPVTQMNPQKKHGYVIKAWGATDFSSYGVLYDQGYNDPSPVYVRLWFKKIDDGEYEVRYEFPWKK